MPKQKKLVYQVFTRLFGNTNTTNKPWGTLEENGVGKFNDFSDKALQEIQKLGVTHIWYTGVPHHAVINDYTKHGISNDYPSIVKGRAGSPYAVKDYYNVNPDLAVNVDKRLEEFEALIKRTHQNNLKVIIDIVPNHVARNYKSLTNPDEVEDFGLSDNTSVEYDRNNNFYYVPNQNFKTPEWLDGYLPLDGEIIPQELTVFKEYPAKWTGNGSRAAQPHFYDWYETVKINYGVKPDGSYDFDLLPQDFSQKSHKEHYEFWRNKNVPDSWIKFRDIALYWINKGVDGFRYDMAELVPIEFWSFLNSSIKMLNPEAFLLAEVYQPHLYRDYLFKGKMDYLYDKADLYDTLKDIIQKKSSTDRLVDIQNELADIEHNMLHFLENHDEQRIASPEFAGDAERGKPMMVLSSTISTSPTMIYFGQEVGEAAIENLGFGSASRTSIFDYGGVPSHQRWMNKGKFDGGQLSKKEKELRKFYSQLFNLTKNSSALMGHYREIHSFNRQYTEWYNDKVFSFVRWSNKQRFIIICNFSSTDGFGFDLQIPSDIISEWNLLDNNYSIKNLLGDTKTFVLSILKQQAKIRIDIDALESFIISV